MLKKGEANMENYKTFDYSQLNPIQLKTIDHLSIYSRLIPYFKEYLKTPKVSMDIKIQYLEDNSLKLGNAFFSKVEFA